jgi:hypothetical protein
MNAAKLSIEELMLSVLRGSIRLPIGFLAAQISQRATVDSRTRGRNP